MYYMTPFVMLSLAKIKSILCNTGYSTQNRGEHTWPIDFDKGARAIA